MITLRVICTNLTLRNTKQINCASGDDFKTNMIVYTWPQKTFRRFTQIKPLVWGRAFDLLLYCVTSAAMPLVKFEQVPHYFRKASGVKLSSHFKSLNICSVWLVAFQGFSCVFISKRRDQQSVSSTSRGWSSYKSFFQRKETKKRLDSYVTTVYVTIAYVIGDAPWML